MLGTSQSQTRRNDKYELANYKRGGISSRFTMGVRTDIGFFLGSTRRSVVAYLRFY